MSNRQQVVQSEHIDNEDMQLEVEDETLADGSIRPYDPEEIRVDTNTFSLRNVLDMIQDDEIDLAPDFQRFKVWTSEQKSRLVESVLLRIPLPAFYFSSDKKGRMQVVDGVQRLSTLYEFVRSPESFPLTNLEYLSDQLRGKVFADLEVEWTSRINRTQLTVNVIDPKTPHRVKFDIFKRLNTGGAPLTAQEIRHCMSKSRSRDFLRRIVESPEFKRALPPQIVNHKRMANREMVLRAAGFLLQRGDETGVSRYTGKAFKDYASLDEFLNDVTEVIDEKLSDEELRDLEKSLISGIDNSYRLFEDSAFRKPDLYRKNPINKSLFEVWVVNLAPYDWNDIQPMVRDIQVNFFDKFEEDFEFDESISGGTASAAKVRYRFMAIREVLTASDL